MPSSFNSSGVPQNKLLAQLQRSDFNRLLPHLRPVALPFGEVLHEVEDNIDRIYFPTAGLVSLVLTDQENHDVETALVGREGLIGYSAILSDGVAAQRSQVHVGGSGLFIAAATLRDAFDTSSALRNVLLRYVDSLLGQMAQNALCNARHPLQERLCRWLLTCADRLECEEFAVTQEFIATMLGTPHSGIAVIMGIMHNARLCNYRGGHVQLLNRDEMESIACGCYDIMCSDFDKSAG